MAAQILIETYWTPRGVFDSPIVQRSKHEGAISGSRSSHTNDSQLNKKRFGPNAQVHRSQYHREGWQSL